jgi:16S rRNA processing protein RimM
VARLRHDDDPPLPEDAVEVARVLGAWGVKGGIKLKPFSADPQALFSASAGSCSPANASCCPRRPAPRRAGRCRACCAWCRRASRATASSPPARTWTDRDAAEALTGARIFVSRASFPTPDDNEFYWVDLIGLAVRNRDGLDLGTVSHLIETGPHCVLRIRAADAEGPTKC